MIVELFGPPGVGKTTCAAALAAELRRRGLAVNTIASVRPAEQGRAVGPVPALRRVIRPLLQTLAATRMSGTAEAVATPAGLLQLLPPQSPLWSLRLHGYLVRLFNAWEAADAVPGVTLFDQAFVQAVGSLILLGRRSQDPSLAAVALAAVPRPDLLVRLAAAPELIERRLRLRARGQGRLERLLELDLETNLRSIGIIDQLSGRLLDSSRVVHVINSTTPDSLAAGVDWIAGVVGAPGPARIQPEPALAAS